MAQDSSSQPAPMKLPAAGANGTPVAAPIPKTKAPKKQPEQPEGPRDTLREIAETVVFVVVLVLMLKLFVAEAFVIPTGSMATTLWGDQYTCTCRECGYQFPVGARDREISKDDDPKRSSNRTWYICENCGYALSDYRFPTEDFSSKSSGDRVLVSKYEYHLRNPRRFEVPVFKYPEEPFAKEQQQAMNYIKRLVGLGNETIGVFSGDLYRTTALTYPHRPRPANELDAWQYPWTYASDPEAIAAFKRGEFEVIRKEPAQILAERRMVFDLNHQFKSAEGIRKQRWHPTPDDGAGWAMDATGFHHSGDAVGWVRYQHVRPTDGKIFYITDYLGYNLNPDGADRKDLHHPEDNSPFRELTGCYSGRSRDVCQPPNWVSDLMLECEAEISNVDAEIILDLAKGPERFQVRFKSGQCRLYRLPENGAEPIELGSRATRITKPGRYKLRFANFDCRMTIWVDGRVLSFAAHETDYAPPPADRKFEPTANDLDQPARIGARGDVHCTNVKLWRDIFYSCSGRDEATKLGPLLPDPQIEGLMPVCKADYVQTYYVQPGHYLAFGDNSNSSADSRTWGLVPHRLLLGRAIVVYFPLWRLGVIE